jgi:DNA-binding MarR family transcriptional regulator
MRSDLDNIGFHLMRQLIQDHTARWQCEMPHLTKPQYSVMRAIAERPGIEQIELMSASVTTKATLAEMLGRMEERGLIYREQGATDKRRRYVFLTDAGKSLLEATIPLATTVDEFFLNRLSRKEQLEFIRLLKVMIAGQTDTNDD